MKWNRLFKYILGFTITVVFYCEFFVYYVVLLRCNWPMLPLQDSSSPHLNPVNALIIADIHLLGPVGGHWFDKLFREWHMHRAFQTSMTIFKPELVIILGDVFDEGHMVNDDYFNEYVHRYHQLFYTPKTTQVIGVVGNHDVGFHYRMHPVLMQRFEKEFNNTGVQLYTIKDVHFVVINSMAMENDKCSFCAKAQQELDYIGKKLMCMKHTNLPNCQGPHMMYSRPVLLQHFPTYRISDAACAERDTPKIQRYRENWDVLSIDSTKALGNTINPRLAFSGHTHHYCKLVNRLGIDEYSVASLSWRNKLNPSLLLAKFTPFHHTVAKCDLPVQTTNVTIYISAFIVCITAITLKLSSVIISKIRRKKLD